MSKTGDVPIRRCNRCGQEEHGTAGCDKDVRGSQMRHKVYFPPATYRVINGQMFRVIDDYPPGAKPFRLREKKEE